MQSQFEIEDLKRTFQRRKYYFIYTFIAIALGVIVISIILPPVYRSQITIQIEEQEVSSDYIRSTVTSYVEERLGMITQQVMSRSILNKIIKLFDLYPEMRKREVWGR